jgi:hypothetical protein
MKRNGLKRIDGKITHSSRRRNPIDSVMVQTNVI